MCAMRVNRQKSISYHMNCLSRVSSVPLELVHTDVWGPAIKSSGGFSYYVSFLDDFSKFTWVYLLKHKSDVEHVFYQFQKRVELSLGTKIRSVQSDWGGEYQKLHKYFLETGVSHRISCPHTHQQNGAIERKHRHLVETALALLAQSCVPLRFWDDAILTACYLINRMPSRVTHNITPVTKLFQTPVDYNLLRVFGCACWPNLRPYNNKKLAFRSHQCVFLGYSPDHLGFRCLDRSSGHIYVSRDVVFDEHVYPFSAGSPSDLPPPTEHALLLPEPDITTSTCTDMTRATNGTPVVSGVSGAPLPPVDPQLHGVHVAPDVDQPVPAVQPAPAAPHGPAPNPDHLDEPTPPPSPPTPARGPALDAPSPVAFPAPSPDTVSPAPSLSPQAAPAPPSPMRTRLKNNVIRPLRLFEGIVRYDQKKKAFSAEPVSHIDALQTPA